MTDLPDNFDLIDGVIKSLDVESDQINIAVKFVETSLRHNEVLGINWELREEMHLDKNLDTDSLKLLDLGLKRANHQFCDSESLLVHLPFYRCWQMIKVQN